MILDRDARVRPLRRKVANCEPFRPSRKLLNGRQYHLEILGQLQASDPRMYQLIKREYDRQSTTLQLIAAENLCSRAVLGALGSIVQNKTTEGFVGARFHGGCEHIDNIEQTAIQRAQHAFGARYANVQPHSGTSANQIVFTAMLSHGDRILSLGLDQGGHVSHGAKVSFAGKFFDVHFYTVDAQTYQLDYEQIARQAEQIKPKLIICGASAYSRTIDFARFRALADRVGAYLLADISHIAGLVSAGLHPSPVDYAHFTTTSTYKPGGPRGGLILMGRDYDRTIPIGSQERPLWKHLNKTTFPGVQGTPYMNNIAAKAVFFKEMVSPEYRARQYAIIKNAQSLAGRLLDLGFHVLTGGTDTHMILVNVTQFQTGLTGWVAQKCLEECGIIVNMNRLPFDPKGQRITSGIRLGTPIVTRNGMTTRHMPKIAQLVHDVLHAVEPCSDSEYRLNTSFRDQIRTRVADLCRHFPIP